MMISRSLLVLGLGLLTAGAAFAQHEAELDPAMNDVSDTPSLQRGARYFVNYCLGCHSAQYVRYNRLAEDLQIPEDLLVEDLMFTGELPFDTMSIAMRGEDAARWFGVEPPDLTLIARSRGTDYVYTFLRSFYVDTSRPTGVDNVVLPGTAMPHVLWELQGLQTAEFEEAEDGTEHFMGFEATAPGMLNPAEYDSTVRDIVNFLDYIAEPVQLERQRLGVRVIGFLLVLLLISYLLKKEIWKDVE
jgi:ubiquinol-cytochrome c reductase cytochrome c1 subunit